MECVDYWKMKGQAAPLSQLPILIHLAVAAPPFGIINRD
jgi:hypothetical protein